MGVSRPPPPLGGALPTPADTSFENGSHPGMGMILKRLAWIARQRKSGRIVTGPTAAARMVAVRQRWGGT
jgi:hypothetical protein